jgi:hypothetical protein
VPYGASHIETAERVTHVMRKTKNEIKKLQVAGFYSDVDLGDPQPYHSDIEKRKAEEGGFSLTDDDRYALYEVHADLIIEGVDDSDEDIAKPYVVTIERGTNEVLSISAVTGTLMTHLHAEAPALRTLCLCAGIWFLWAWANSYHWWIC